MNQHKTKAFTLVELLIVIAILSILSTIAFISFSGYVNKSKAAKNQSTLRTIEKGITTYLTKTSRLPFPDDVFSTGTVNITGNSMNILFTGYLGKTVSEFIGSNDVPKNAFDESLLYYGISSNKKYFQIGLFQPQTVSSHFSQTYAQNDTMRLSGNYGYPLVISDKIINVPSLLLENSSGMYLTNSSTFFVNNKTKSTSVTSGLQELTMKSGLSFTGIILEDWRVQSGTIAAALGYDIESAGIKVFGAKKYYNTIVNQPALPIIPVFSTSSTIGEVKTVNGTKVVFAGTLSGTLYMTHPSCGNIAGTNAFRLDCSGSGCLKGYFNEARDGNYSNWNLNCDNSMLDITTRWDGGFGSFNCGGDNTICNSPTDGQKNTQDIVNEYQARGNYSTAAHFCKNLRIGGYDDWYLPSQNELLHFYNNRNTIGGFGTGNYISSTESTTNTGFLMRVSMSGGGVTGTYKYSYLLTRCIRKVNN